MAKSTARKSSKCVRAWESRNRAGVQYALSDNGTTYCREYGFNGYGMGWSKWTVSPSTAADILRNIQRSKEDPNYGKSVWMELSEGYGKAWRLPL